MLPERAAPPRGPRRNRSYGPSVGFQWAHLPRPRKAHQVMPFRQRVALQTKGLAQQTLDSVSHNRIAALATDGQPQSAVRQPVGHREDDKMPVRSRTPAPKDPRKGLLPRQPSRSPECLPCRHAINPLTRGRFNRRPGRLQCSPLLRIGNHCGNRIATTRETTCFSKWAHNTPWDRPSGGKIEHLAGSSGRCHTFCRPCCAENPRWALLLRGLRSYGILQRG